MLGWNSIRKPINKRCATSPPKARTTSDDPSLRRSHTARTTHCRGPDASRGIAGPGPPRRTDRGLGGGTSRNFCSPAARSAASTIRRHDDPRQFLLDVMNDPSVAMELRIEAAKALLKP